MTDEPIPILNLPGDEDFIRLPGLFRRWELNDVVELGADFHLEDAGEAADGTQLIAVYRLALAQARGRWRQGRRRLPG